MNKGMLQQLDTPQHLYDFPANMFVAGFIGSPAMNFFSAKVMKEENKYFVDSGNFKVQIPENRVNTYAHMEGKDVIFGIRPENIHNPSFTPSEIHGATIEAKVDVTELMGNEIFLYMISGSNNFVARVDPRTRFQIGEVVKLVLDMDNFHIFDPTDDPENPRAVR